MSGHSKSSLSTALFEDAFRAFAASFAALEAENAELRAKLAAATARLAQYEPSEGAEGAGEATATVAVASPVKKEEEKKKEEKKEEGPSKFRAVKDFLFKSKPKTGEEDPKARVQTGDPSKRKGSLLSKKLDRWNFRTSLEGHSGGVLDVAFCEFDPNLVGSASRDGTARLWSLENAGCAAVFAGHKGVVNSVRINHSSLSRLVCTAGVDGTCHVFRIPAFVLQQQRSPKLQDNPSYQPAESPARTPENSDGEPLPTPPHTPRSVTPRAGMSGSSSAGLVDAVVSLPSMSVMREHDGEVVACDWMCASETVVSGSKDSSIRVWDVTTGQSQRVSVQFPAADNAPHLTNIASHPSQPTVMGPGSDGLCRVWDVREMKLSDLISHSTERCCVTHALFSHDGGLIITGGDDRLVKLWDARNTAQPLDAIRCNTVQTKFSLSQRTNTLSIPMRDSKIKICDTQGYNVGSCETQKHHKDALTTSVWSEDESVLVTSSLDEKNNLCVWHREPVVTK